MKSADIQEALDKLPKEYEEKQKLGENDEYICGLIREDRIEDFISFVKTRQIPLSSKIHKSIFETNSFLSKEDPSLIEYAAFFGSIKIFQYLLKRKVDLNRKLLLYATHSESLELIQILEKKHLELDENIYEECFYESIKSYYNDIAIYIQNNYLRDFDENRHFNQRFESYNFDFIEEKNVSRFSIYSLCEYDYYCLVDMALKKVSDEKIEEDLNKLTGFQIAVEKGNIEIVHLLLDNEKININNEERGKTALYCAVENENIEMTKILLLNENIDVNLSYVSFVSNREDSFKMNALHIAVEKENIEIVKLLLANEKLDINSYCKSFEKKNNEIEKTALHIAVEKENIEIVNLLLANEKLDVNSYCKTSERKYYEKEKTALHIAVEKANIEIIKLLLSNEKIGINLLLKSNKEDKTALYIAIEKENIEIVNLLLANEKLDINAYCKISDKEETALHHAIEKANIEIVKLLLSNEKIDINLPYKSDEVEETALHIAIEKANIEIVKLLLSNEKIDINLPFKISFSRSRRHGDEEIELNLQAEMSALYMAVDNQHIEIVKLLISEKNLDINFFLNQMDEAEKFQKTPLHVAIEKENIEIVRLLMTREDLDINIACKTSIKNFEYTNLYGYYDDYEITKEEEKTALNLVKKTLPPSQFKIIISLYFKYELIFYNLIIFMLII